jgi:hypothetical protein
MVRNPPMESKISEITMVTITKATKTAYVTTVKVVTKVTMVTKVLMVSKLNTVTKPNVVPELINTIMVTEVTTGKYSNQSTHDTKATDHRQPI